MFPSHSARQGPKVRSRGSGKWGYVLGRPENIANCILFVSSEKASYINGASVIIDGDYLRGPDWGI